MRALLDINVLIALFDPDHAFHERAHVWWGANSTTGWASSPITENGLVRIMSHGNYSQKIRFTPAEIIGRLQLFTSQTNHQFWIENISLRDASVFVHERIHSSRQLTDIYLLGLAVKYQGRLATFDNGIPPSAVKGADGRALCVI